MKQFFFISLCLFTVLLFSYCSSSKKSTASKPVAVVNYETGVKHLVVENCSPCHFPEKGGNKLAFDSYDAVKNNIDEMIARMERNPGERGFMPFRRAKLSDSTIAVFKEWKANGFAAK